MTLWQMGTPCSDILLSSICGVSTFTWVNFATSTKLYWKPDSISFLDPIAGCHIQPVRNHCSPSVFLDKAFVETFNLAKICSDMVWSSRLRHLWIFQTSLTRKVWLGLVCTPTLYYCIYAMIKILFDDLIK